MKAKKKEDRYNVPALDKALDILEYLSTSSTPLPLSTIAKELNKTSSEVFRVVNCLVKRNYLIKDPTVNAYSLSLKFFELTNSTPPIKRLIDACVLPLGELAKEIRFSCHVSVLEDGDLVVLYEQEGVDIIHVHVKAGFRTPATRGTSGKIILAQLDAAERESVLHRDAHYLSLSEEGKRALLEQSDGYAGLECIHKPSDMHSDITDIATFLPLPRFRYAAIVVPVFQSSFDPPLRIDVLKEKILTARDKIRKSLGT